MKRRDVMNLAAGLMIGLLIGMVLVGSSDDLRTSLFGSASEKPKDTAYFLIDLPTAEQWLSESFPETDEALAKALEFAAKLPTSEDRQDFVNAKETADSTLLPQMYAALTGADRVDEAKVGADNKTSVCLGIDDNPYNANPDVYLYVTLPSEQAKKLELTKLWQQLEESKEGDLYWQPLACYPAGDKK